LGESVAAITAPTSGSASATREVSVAAGPAGPAVTTESVEARLTAKTGLAQPTVRAVDTEVTIAVRTVSTLVAVRAIAATVEKDITAVASVPTIGTDQSGSALTALTAADGNAISFESPKNAVNRHRSTVTTIAPGVTTAADATHNVIAADDQRRFEFNATPKAAISGFLRLISREPGSVSTRGTFYTPVNNDESLAAKPDISAVAAATLDRPRNASQDAVDHDLVSTDNSRFVR